MELGFLAVGLFVGAFAAWFIAKYKFSSQSGSLPHDVVQEKYVLREVYDSLQTQADLHRDDLLDKEQELRKLGTELGTQVQKVQYLERDLVQQREEVERVREQLRLEFENTANRLLEEKSLKYSQQHQQQLQDILLPLREKIHSFEEGIEKRFLEETRDRVSLKKEIEQLAQLNQQLSADANRLVDALRGDSKMQGDWGEFQLEMLLEKAGLVRDIHYLPQASFKDADGRDKRPDFVINLPEGKHLILDSKVSLVAYERFFNAEREEERRQHLKAHIQSLRQHIKDLNSKNYQQLYQVNSPDYLLLFVPIEPAYALAVQEDQQLFLDALDKNIVIVTHSTLLATLRTVSYIWKQEKQQKSVLEIARQSGLLYDKFCGFVEDLQGIGQRLEAATKAYDAAMNKLSDSRKFGDTLVGRAERIRELGAKAAKRLPQNLLEEKD
ncbi:MAG: DNA recombination protein RmuC [Bacteroidota bacterium]